MLVLVYGGKARFQRGRCNSSLTYRVSMKEVETLNPKPNE
jgi:hypothetical protein